MILHPGIISRSHAMQTPSNNDLFKKIELGVRRGVARALYEHKQKGRSIFVSEDNKIVEISPEDISINKEDLPPDLQGK